MDRRIQVFGPAYLDRVVQVDRPLLGPHDGTPLDQSVDGVWLFAEGLELVDLDGRTIALTVDDDWSGPTGRIALSDPIAIAIGPKGDAASWRREVRAVSWHDDLGGMGAGFAASLQGELIGALGPEDDPTSRAISDLLARQGITHRPIRVAGHAADWTLLITSGGHGDKLPIGFRGCHASLSPEVIGGLVADRCDVRVVASLPNALSAQLLRRPGATVRFFAPTMRNMRDRETPLSRFAETIDVLSCNRREWESLADREEVAWQVSILAITDGPHGSRVRFTTPTGDPGLLTVPALPRSHPPRDTNRAGEAYAATLLSTLLDDGWAPGVADEAVVAHAAGRATAAAALVLDRLDFGFPTADEIDDAVRAGRIDGSTGVVSGPLR